MNVATGMRVVATRPVDFRKGHDGLAAVVEHELGLDPYSGVALVFRPKRMNRVKVLWVGGVHSIAYGDPLPEAKSGRSGTFHQRRGDAAFRSGATRAWTCPVSDVGTRA